MLNGDSGASWIAEDTSNCSLCVNLVSYQTVAFIRVGVGAPRVRTTKEVSMNERRELSHEEITHVAYGLYLERGCEPGRDIEDWFKAEKVLRNGAVLQVGKAKTAQAGSN
jgi:hypothetical protein